MNLFNTTTLLLTLLLYSGQSYPWESRAYLGGHWMHLSNVDAGPPVNDTKEDQANHLGVEVEFQWVNEEGSMWFVGVGVGWSTFLSADRSKDGWECGGCKLPATLHLGYKWRLY
jgi:hypothetical protein